MVADSEKFAEEDELIKKKIESRNALENRSSPPSYLLLSHTDVVYLHSHLLSQGSAR